jgi:hypothetical protein
MSTSTLGYRNYNGRQTWMIHLKPAYTGMRRC